MLKRERGRERERDEMENLFFQKGLSTWYGSISDKKKRKKVEGQMNVK